MPATLQPRRRLRFPSSLCCAVLVAVGCKMCLCAAARGSPLVIMDGDFGEWLDDSWALAVLPAHLGESLRLVLSQGRREAGLIAAQMLLEGLPETAPMPAVGLGGDYSGSRLPALSPYLKESLLPTLEAMVAEDGIGHAGEIVEAWISQTAGHPKGHREASVVWICTGSAANLGQFARRYPHLVGVVSPVIMGGSARPGIRLPWGEDCCTTPVNETNVCMDIQSSQLVLASKWASPIMYAPIESTYNSELSGFWYSQVWRAAFPDPLCRQEMRQRMDLAGTEAYQRKYGRSYQVACPGNSSQGHNRMARALLQLYLAWINEVMLGDPEWSGIGEVSNIMEEKAWQHRTPALFDLFAAAQYLLPQFFDLRDSSLTISSSGQTLVNSTQPSTAVVWGWNCTQPGALWDALMPVFLDTSIYPPVELQRPTATGSSSKRESTLRKYSQAARHSVAPSS